MSDMAGSITAMDLIVLIAVAFAVAFLIAWACSRNLRAWIERPKYRFLMDVERADVGSHDRSPK
jgi:hypothetical protein